MQQAALSAILFDLDGTLIDSIELILRSYEHTIAAHGKDAVDRDVILAKIGIPLWTHLGTFADEPHEVEAMMATYREWNLAHHDEFVRPFAGIDRALCGFQERGMPMAIVTSKVSDTAWRGLRLCGLAEYFDILVGSDSVERHKPDPTPVLAGCARLGVEPSVCGYVGDSVHDMVAARAAGTRAIGAGWGPFEHADLRAAGAEHLALKPEDLVDMVAPRSAGH